MPAIAFITFVFAVLLGCAWQIRARAARRYHSVLDAYADREIATKLRSRPVRR